MDYEELDPSTVSGILKTILLFLEGQNFNKTCETFLWETRQMGYSMIKEATAQLLILKPAVTETVTVTRAEPDTKIQCNCQKEQVDENILKNTYPPVCSQFYYASPRRTSHIVHQQTSVEYQVEKKLTFDTTCHSPSLASNCSRPPSPRALTGQETIPKDSNSTTPQVIGNIHCLSDTPTSANESLKSSVKSDISKTDEVSNCQMRCQELSYTLDKCSLDALPGETKQGLPYSLNKCSLDTLTGKQEIHPEDLCFPCEGCNDITPISGRSIPSDIPSKNSESSVPTKSQIESDNDEQNVQVMCDAPVSTECCKPHDLDSNKDSTSTTLTDYIDNQHMPMTGIIVNDDPPKIPPPTERNTTKCNPPLTKTVIKTCSLINTLGTQETSCQNNNENVENFQDEEFTEKVSTSTDVGEFIQHNLLDGVLKNQKQSMPVHGDGAKQLDYNKFKHDLNTASFKNKLLLLQALRWKITKSESSIREKVMIGMAKHDLLSLHGNACGQGYCLLTNFLLTTDHPSDLQEGIARFLNALASGTIGRDYLCQDDSTLRHTIVPLVKGKHEVTISDVTKEHLLVMLQKLSLRSKMRIVMIECGLPEYLVEFISNKHTKVSAYCLEYTCALFMNLCLHKETRIGMRNISNYLITMLTNFVQSAHIHCLPYMNGAMYSLFNDVSIISQARNSALYKTLLKKVKQFDGDIKQQLELIITVLQEGKQLPPCADCQSANEDIEIDHIEIEIDMDDTVTGNPNGEELLKAYMVGEMVKNDPPELLCVCIPVAPHKKITAKSFCSPGYVGKPSPLDAVLPTVADIDREILQAQPKSFESAKLPNYKTASGFCEELTLFDSEPTFQKKCSMVGHDTSGSFKSAGSDTQFRDASCGCNEPSCKCYSSHCGPSTKDATISARVLQKTRGTNIRNLFRDRYDPPRPILYEPKLRCMYPSTNQGERRQNQTTKYSCNCYEQIQKFVENQCCTCNYPSCGQNIDVKVLYDSRFQ